jgi:hypothetical protein
VSFVRGEREGIVEENVVYGIFLSFAFFFVEVVGVQSAV